MQAGLLPPDPRYQQPWHQELVNNAASQLYLDAPSQNQHFNKAPRGQSSSALGQKLWSLSGEDSGAVRVRRGKQPEVGVMHRLRLVRGLGLQEGPR